MIDNSDSRFAVVRFLLITRMFKDRIGFYSVPLPLSIMTITTSSNVIGVLPGLIFSDHSVEFSLDNVSTGDIFSNSYICFFGNCNGHD